MSEQMCRSDLWRGISPDMQKCETCGYEAHWMDLRPHSVTAPARQEIEQKQAHTDFIRWRDAYNEDVQYRRGICPASGVLTR